MVAVRTWRNVVALMVAAAATFGGVHLASGGTTATPLPTGSDESLFISPNGQYDLARTPDRAPVLALDGTPLLGADGKQLTAPLGDSLRGVITSQQAAAQIADLQRQAREDACRRGVKVGIYGESRDGARSLEESMAQAKADLESKLKANGGDPMTSAC
jgi:hypothetical protein